MWRRSSNPGVTVQTGSRVGDVLEMAGGLRKDADSNYVAQSINKAMKVVDGMKIYIPSVAETSYINIKLPSSTVNDVAQSINTSNNSGISINMASKDQLETLTGVGPVTAQKIIDNRPYQTLEELISKKAVGQSVFEKIKQQIDL
jgi:competence protein ComEA